MGSGESALEAEPPGESSQERLGGHEGMNLEKVCRKNVLASAKALRQTQPGKGRQWEREGGLGEAGGVKLVEAPGLC